MGINSLTTETYFAYDEPIRASRSSALYRVGNVRTCEDFDVVRGTLPLAIGGATPWSKTSEVAASRSLVYVSCSHPTV